MDAVDGRYYTDLLRPLFEGRRVIVTGTVLGGAIQIVNDIRSAGASEVFVLAEGRGTGDPPDQISWFDLDITSDTVVGTLRKGLAALRDLPAAAVDAINRFDPDGSAIVVGSMFHEVAEVAGRPSLAYRSAEWIAYEDKVVIEACWDRWGVERAPSAVVPVDLAALEKAAAGLDIGAGTMWVGDAREGWHGGAEYARWVRSPIDAAEAAAFLVHHCDTARVMPFLEGIPCSIHGIVFDDYVAALRPLEMVVLRKSAGAELEYAGVASYWDPPPADRDHMRNIAKRVGAALRDEVDYRGGFTVDGVMSATGFLPTELNARPGAGLGVLARTLPDLPLWLMLPAIAGGHPLDYRPEDLEALLLRRADETRGGGTWRALHVPVPAEGPTPLRHGSDGWATCSDDEQADASFAAGESPTGAFVRLILNSEVWPVGSSVAPAAAEFWRFFAERNQLDDAVLSPAKDVQR